MQYVFKKKVLTVIVSLVDMIGYILSGLTRLLVRNSPRIEPAKILLIRIDHIGDVVLAECVIKPLREKYPDAVIDFLAPVWAAEILRGNPYLNNVLEFDPPWFRRTSCAMGVHLKGFLRLIDMIKKKRYDTVIDLRGDLRHIAAMFLSGAKTRIGYGITGGGFLLTHNVPYDRSKYESRKDLVLLEPLGIKARDINPEIFYNEKELTKAAAVKEEAGVVGAYAVIHAVPGYASKKWSTVNFFEVVKYIRDIKRLLPVFIGTDKDKAFIQEIIGLLIGGVVDLSGKTDLKTIAKLIDGASIFIGLDSGPAHLAATTGTPGIVLFSGVNNEEQWAPAGEKIQIICPGRNKGLSEVSAGEVCRAIDGIIGISVTRGI